MEKNAALGYERSRTFTGPFSRGSRAPRRILGEKGSPAPVGAQRESRRCGDGKRERDGAPLRRAREKREAGMGRARRQVARSDASARRKRLGRSHSSTAQRRGVRGARERARNGDD